MMLAAFYYGPQDIRLEETSTPVPGPGEVLVQVQAASICGTDMRIWQGQHRKFTPGTRRIPGHETAGVVAEIGAGVAGLAIGQPVFVAPNMGCGHCPECIAGNNNRCSAYQAIGVTLDGAFAEYVRMPAAGVQQGALIPLAAGVDPAAAALIEPLACVLRGQNAVSVGTGDVVLIMGAGPIGVLHLKLARLRGASRVIVSEPDAIRRERAVALGADRVADPLHEDLGALLAEETGGRGADVTITAAPSHQAQQSALALAAIGGRINFFGGLPKDQPMIQFDSNLVHYKELLVTGTTACSSADCWQAARIVNSGRIVLDDLISLRLQLEQISAAFAAAQNPRNLKVVVEPGRGH